MLSIKRDQKIDLLKKVPMFSSLSNRHLIEMGYFITKHKINNIGDQTQDIVIG